MRLKKSIINSSVGMGGYLLSFLPSFIVRKVFVMVLGVELLGLSSLYSNIIGYLSIAEMGIGSAIIFCLYKPYADGDFQKVKGYLDYYKKFYRIIGSVILVVGIIVTFFLQVFIHQKININVVRIGFLLVLINTVIGYMFTYKYCLVNVAQENYKLSIVTTVSKILIAIIQVAVLYLYKNFYAYIIVQIVVNLTFYILMNSYINKKFAWVKQTKGNVTKAEEKELIKGVKALFYHKIGEVFVFGTDNIVISSFVSLSAIGIYTNYSLITNALGGLVGQAMTGLTSSIGELLVTKDKSYSHTIFKKIFFVNFWVSSFICIALYNSITQFVIIWMGRQYTLNIFVVSLILANLYFLMMRGATDKFQMAAGEYQKDKYAPLVEGLLNLVSSIILVNIIGLPGVFLGTFISNIAVIFWIKPYIVYKYVFDKPLIGYFKLYFKYLIIGAIPFVITNYITTNIRDKASIGAFLLNCLINIVVINLVYLVIFWRNAEFKYFKNMILTIIRKKVLKRA